MSMVTKDDQRYEVNIWERKFLWVVMIVVLRVSCFEENDNR